jgi:diguanylate cyclase (GGDEF)-like protein
VLKALAQLLQSQVRQTDLVARYGGEEFVLVLPETDAQSARSMAERCRELIEQTQMPHEKSKVAPVLTVSLGVGAVVPTTTDEPLSLIDAVDRALYQAKLQGRNRIAMADES